MITPYEDRLIEDLQASLRDALRILERDVGRVGKPCPTRAQVAAIRAQAAQAAQQASELFGAMSVREG